MYMKSNKKQIIESFSSKKLATLAKEHGGIKVGRNGGLRDGTYAYYGGSSIDLSKVTDDMLEGDAYKFDWETATPEQRNNHITFNDGYVIGLKPYNLTKDDNIEIPGRKEKPSRYGTGIGDTGDHNKAESPFFKNGKKDVGPQYNGFGVSSRAGESQHYREAFKNNKEDYEYFKTHPERSDSKEGMRKAASNMDTIIGYGRKLLNKNENKNMKNTMKLTESQLKNIITESVNRILKEGLFTPTEFDENVAQKAQCPSDVFKMNYWAGRTESKDNGELVLRCYTDNNSMQTRNYPDFEKVVNDLNQYYKLHGSKSVAQALPDDGTSRGRLLKITKQA